VDPAKPKPTGQGSDPYLNDQDAANQWK
jgi:hypothetical protein